MHWKHQVFLALNSRKKMLSWRLYKGHWTALFILLIFRHLLTCCGPGPVPYTVGTEMKKAQLCPEVVHSPVRRKQRKQWQKPETGAITEVEQGRKNWEPCLGRGAGSRKEVISSQDVKDGEQFPGEKRNKEEILTDVIFTLGYSEGLGADTI